MSLYATPASATTTGMKREPLDENNNTGFCDSLKDKARQRHVLSGVYSGNSELPEAKEGQAYIYKKHAKYEISHAPFKIIDDEKKTDPMLKTFHVYAQREVQNLATQDMIVGDKVVYLLEHQKEKIRALKGDDLGYQVKQALLYMFYQKGDQRMLLTFEAKLNAAFGDLKLAEQNPAQYLENIWTGRKQVQAVHTLGDKYLDDYELVGKVLFHLQRVDCYKILVNNMRTWNDMAVKFKKDNEENRYGWTKLHEYMLAEHRERRMEAEPEEKEVEPSVQPSAQVGRFQVMQQRGEERRSDDERDDRRGQGYERRDNEGRRFSDRRGNRRNRGDAKRKCYCCGSLDHLVRKCPKRYDAKEDEGQDS